MSVVYVFYLEVIMVKLLFFSKVSDILKPSIIVHILPLPVRQHWYLAVLSCISNRINAYLIAKIWEIDACAIYPIPSSSEFHPNHSTVNSIQCRRIQSCSWHLFHGITSTTKNFCSSFSFALNCCVFLKTPLITGFLKRRLQLDQQMAPASHSFSVFAPVRIGGGCS